MYRAPGRHPPVFYFGALASQKCGVHIFVESCLCPWRRSNQSGVLQSLCIVPVYKPAAIRYKPSAVIPLDALTSTVVTPIRLYPLYCTLYYCILTLTLTCRQPSALVALSFALVSDFVLKILQCTLHQLQLSQHFFACDFVQKSTVSFEILLPHIRNSLSFQNVTRGQNVGGQNITRF